MEATGGAVLKTDRFVLRSETMSRLEEAEAEARKRVFLPYQVNEAMFAHAAPDAVFLHCLPAHRGEEVTAGVIDSPRSIVFQEAENRLHAQKAIMLELMK